MGRPMTPTTSPMVMATPHQERMMSLLEQRAKMAEYESDVAAEQQARSRSMMSQKMGDMTKLQNALTNQAKVNLCNTSLELHGPLITEITEINIDVLNNIIFDFLGVDNKIILPEKMYWFIVC